MLLSSFVRKYFLFLFAVLLMGCASNVSVIDKPQFSFVSLEPSNAGSDLVLKVIEERNNTIEKNPNWISQAYRQLLIKELSDVDEVAYSDYGKFLDAGALYIIVHPAYYTFFDSDYFFNPHDAPIDNVVIQLLKEPAYTGKMRLMQAQERMMLDFLEYSSTKKNLMILVLPGDYSDATFYRYANTKDEYMRYINESTNESMSVLIVYSKRPNKGSLAASDQKRLVRFLSAVVPQRILIGGGYMGRCVEDLYKDLTSIYSKDKVYIVPEITAWSPSDISSDQATALLNLDGTANIAMITEAAGKRLQTAKRTNLQMRNLGN